MGNIYLGFLFKTTPNRITSGGKYPHKNNFSVFRNYPDRTTGISGLPKQPNGYY